MRIKKYLHALVRRSDQTSIYKTSITCTYTYQFKSLTQNMHSPLKPHFTTRLRRRRCFPVHIIAPRVQIKKIHIICTAQRRLMLYIYSDVWLFNVLQHNKTALVKRLSCCVVREEDVCLCFYAHSHYKAIKLSRWTAENFILCSSALSTSDPMG